MDEIECFGDVLLNGIGGGLIGDGCSLVVVVVDDPKVNKDSCSFVVLLLLVDGEGIVSSSVVIVLVADICSSYSTALS